MLRAWMQESVRPATTYAERPGRWIAEPEWPPRIVKTATFHLSGRSLSEAPGVGEATIIASSLATGIGFGEWCPYGLAGELPADQRADDGRSVFFDSDPLARRIEIFGAPVVSLKLTSDRPSAMIAARLEDVAPDGSSTLVTYGLLNLTHRDGHGAPRPLDPGEACHVRVVLNDIAQAFPAGHRIRLALATSHWPIAWPSPETARLKLSTGDSTLTLPLREPSPMDDTLASFPDPEQAMPEPHEITRLAGRNRTILEDPTTGEVTVTVHRERASYVLPNIGLTFESEAEEHYQIREGDPSATSAETRATWKLSRAGWRIRTETSTRVTCTAEAFQIEASLDAFEGDAHVANRKWARSIPRMHV
jgi:predicted acyl esterase